MRHTAQGGYAGLIMLLVVAAIIGLLAWRSDLFSSGTHATSTSPSAGALSPLPPEPVVEQDLHAIQEAKNAQQQLDNAYQ